MPLRLIPIVAIAVLAALFAFGAFGAFDDSSNADDTFIVDGVISEVDGVLDDALHEDSFDWLSDSLSGAADGVEAGVESIAD